MSKWLLQILYRGVIPFSVMLGIAGLLKHQQKTDDARGTFIASFIVFFVGAASLIYDVDSWSLGKKIGIHYLVMLVTVYPTLLLSGWFPVNNVVDALKVLGFFTAAGAGILAVIGLIFLIKNKLF